MPADTALTGCVTYQKWLVTTGAIPARSPSSSVRPGELGIITARMSTPNVKRSSARAYERPGTSPGSDENTIAEWNTPVRIAVVASMRRSKGDRREPLRQITHCAKYMAHAEGTIQV